MSDTITSSSVCRFDFNLIRGDEETSRRISVEDFQQSTAGLSAAKAFADAFDGSENPFSIIDRKKFVQPTGWRDSDETEDEWQLKNVDITIVDTTVQKVDRNVVKPEATITVTDENGTLKINGVVADVNRLYLLATSVSPPVWNSTVELMKTNGYYYISDNDISAYTFLSGISPETATYAETPILIKKINGVWTKVDSI